jgi:prevent-host-death family protein
MKQISATEANRNFSRLLSAAAKGQETLITSRGKPIAKLSPVSAEIEKRRAARKKLLARLDRQKPRGLKIDWTREDIYERDF